MTKSKKNTIRKNQKREEATERQKRYESLTPEEKLQLIESRPGQSKKERLRVEKLIRFHE